MEGSMLLVNQGGSYDYQDRISRECSNFEVLS